MAQITDAERSAIIRGLEERTMVEISVGGRKYKCTMTTLDMLTGEATRDDGRWGCIVARTNTAVVVVEYPPHSRFWEVHEGVRIMADHLVANGL